MAQKKQMAEELKEMKSKPEISKKSRQMQQHYVPLHLRVSEVIKEKADKVSKLQAENEKKEQETFSATPRDIPQSHYRKNKTQRDRPNAAMKQYKKEFHTKKREVLDKKRREQERDKLADA